MHWLLYKPSICEAIFRLSALDCLGPHRGFRVGWCSHLVSENGDCAVNNNNKTIWTIQYGEWKSHRAKHIPTLLCLIASSDSDTDSHFKATPLEVKDKWSTFWSLHLTMGREAVFTQDRPPVHHRATPNICELWKYERKRRLTSTEDQTSETYQCHRSSSGSNSMLHFISTHGDLSFRCTIQTRCCRFAWWQHILMFKWQPSVPLPHNLVSADLQWLSSSPSLYRASPRVVVSWAGLCSSTCWTGHF